MRSEIQGGRPFMKTFILVAAVILTSLLPYLSLAAEVKNLKIVQEGDKAIATYDLIGLAGEREAEVSVAIIIDGKRRTSDQLGLSGDFGKDVRTGAGKRIVWNATTDLPQGFDGELNRDVRTPRVVVAPASEPKVTQTVDGPSYEETVNFIVNKYHYNNNEQWQERINSIKLVTSVLLEPPPNPTSINVMNVCVESTQFRGKYAFWMHDATFAERFSKALNHLHKLCVAQVDPF
jgi:hypothetical protein